MEELKPRENQVLQAIVHFSEEKGYWPSVREIGAKVGLSSTSTVFYHLNNLECKGYIKRKSKFPRAIQLKSKLMNCPECGQELIPKSGCAYCPYCGWSKCS